MVFFDYAYYLNYESVWILILQVWLLQNLVDADAWRLVVEESWSRMSYSLPIKPAGFIVVPMLSKPKMVYTEHWEVWKTCTGIMELKCNPLSCINVLLISLLTCWFLRWWEMILSCDSGWKIYNMLMDADLLLVINQNLYHVVVFIDFPRIQSSCYF